MLHASGLEQGLLALWALLATSRLLLLWRLLIVCFWHFLIFIVPLLLTSLAAMGRRWGG
jgi:hypothetical protein